MDIIFKIIRPLVILLPVFFSQWTLAVSISDIQKKKQPQLSGISGKIITEKSEPIPYASITLNNTSDSALIKGTTSDNSGVFSISAKPGKYYLEIRFLSFKTKVISDINHGNTPTKLGDIVLKTDTKILDEVEVVGNKSEMTLDIDKRIFNVGTDLTSTGKNAFEILRSVPSVFINADGKVTLRGSSNVRILVNGKESGMAGNNKTNTLQHLEGNLVKSVEIITNPSARYDAEETGIINIVLKKEKQKGMKGSVQLRLGYPILAKASFMLNYQKENVNVFTSYGISRRELIGKGNIFYQFNGSDTSFSYKSTKELTRIQLAHSFMLGTDFFMNKFNTLTVFGFYTYADYDNETEMIYNDFDENNVLAQTVSRNEDADAKKNEIELGVSYIKKFKKEGQEWTSDFKWIQTNDDEQGFLAEKSDINSMQGYQRSDDTEAITYLMAKTDYIHPLGENSKLETGLKATIRKTDKTYTVEIRDADKNWNVFSDFDNRYTYDEDIYAAYIMYNQELKKFSFQLGLRGEFSDIGTQLIKTGESNNNTYFDLFPSAHFAYKLKKKKTLQLSYSRRVTRPKFYLLFPFFSYSDNRYYNSGNPNLKSIYTHSTELGYLKKWEKGSFLCNLYFLNHKDMTSRIMVTDSTGFARYFPINYPTRNKFGIETNFSYKLTSWWQFNTYINFFRQITDGKYQDLKLHSDIYALQGTIFSRITFLKKVNISAFLDILGPSKTTQGKSKSTNLLDIDLSKEILNGNGTLYLSFRNILNSMQRNVVVEGENFYNTSKYRFIPRKYSITLHYYINKNKKSKSKRRYKSRENEYDKGRSEH